MVLPTPAPLNAADRAWAKMQEAIDNDRFPESVQAAQELYSLAAEGIYPFIRFLGHRTQALPSLQVTLSADAQRALRNTTPKRLILAPKRLIDLDADQSGYAQIDGRPYLVTGHGTRRRSAVGPIDEVKRRLQLPASAYDIPWLRDWMDDKHEGYLWSIDAASPGQHLEELDELRIGSFVIQRQETDEGVRFIMGIEDGDTLRDVVTLSPSRQPDASSHVPGGADASTHGQVIRRILQEVLPVLQREGALASTTSDQEQVSRVIHTIGPSMIAAIETRSGTDPVRHLLSFVREAARAATEKAREKVLRVSDRLIQMAGRVVSAEETEELRRELLDAVLPILPENLGARDGALDAFDPLEVDDDDLTLGSRKYIDLDPTHQRIVNELIGALTPAIEAHLLDPQFAKLLVEPTRGVSDATAFMVEKVVADLKRKEAGEKESQLDRVRELLDKAWADRKYAHVRDATVGQMFQRLGVGREALRVKGQNAMRVLGKVFQKLADAIRASVEAADGNPRADQPDWWPSTAEWPQRTAAGPDDIRF